MLQVTNSREDLGTHLQPVSRLLCGGACPTFSWRVCFWPCPGRSTPCARRSYGVSVRMLETYYPHSSGSCPSVLPAKIFWLILLVVNPLEDVSSKPTPWIIGFHLLHAAYWESYFLRLQLSCWACWKWNHWSAGHSSPGCRASLCQPPQCCF